MSSAFDKAWSLLKAPLDLDSIREVGRQPPGNYSPYTEYEADFIHPDTGLKMPMKATYQPRGNDLPNIKTGGTWDRRSWIKANLGGKGTRDDQHYAWAAVEDTKDGPYTANVLNSAWNGRRKGRGTALYDLIARIIHMNTDKHLSPSDSLKPMGRAMWNAQAPDGVWPHDEVRI